SSVDRAAKHPLSLWMASGVFLVGATAPEADAHLLLGGVPLASSEAGSARAAVGVHDEDGMLHWVELPPDARPDEASARRMDAFLAAAGCSSRMLVPGDVRAVLGGSLDVTGDPITAPMASVARLVRTQAPGARSYFESTP